jgi:hypothetical protein
MLVCGIFYLRESVEYGSFNLKDTIENEEISQEFETAEVMFYYDQLSDEEQVAYIKIYQGVTKQKKNIKVRVENQETLDKVYHAVLYDHPEIFWCKLSYNYRHNQTLFGCYEFMPEYLYDREQIEENQEKINQAVKNIMEGISSEESDYQKIVYTYKYLIKLIEYDTSAYENNNEEKDQNIDSAFLDHLTLCAGYAKATQYILNQLGVACTYVTGTVNDNGDIGNHAWNLVKCEDQYYYVDTTWGDPGFSDNSQEPTEEMSINYMYLNCNDKALFRTHTLDSDFGFQYPSCTNLDWNYFVVQKRYFTTYNSQEVKEVIKEDIGQKAELSTFQYSNREAYEKAVRNVKSNVQSGMTMISQKYRLSHVSSQYRIYNDEYIVTIYWKYEE